MSTGGIPSLAELQMHGRHIKEAIDEQPPPVRWSWYLGPTGTLVLLICILTASSTAACKDHCVRVGDALEDRLLRCMDRCEVTTAKAGTCEKQCHSQVHYTRRQVQREQEDCQSGCQHAPTTNRVLAFVAVAAMLPVTPLLGTYRDSCSCECCKGQGCSPKLALFIVAWTAYGFSTLWVAACVAEEPGEVGGKVLFLITQGIAISSMVGSRRLAEFAEAKAAESSYRMAQFGCTGAEMVGATVGSPIAVTQELQATVERLQQEVHDLRKRQVALEEEVFSARRSPEPARRSPEPALLPAEPDSPVKDDDTQELL